MSLAQSVHYSASRHAQLLRDITELDYVPSALSQQSTYLKDLREQVRAADASLKALHAATKKEWKEHVELKDSSVRKFGHKLIGKGDKFKEKVSKEERCAFIYLYPVWLSKMVPA